MMKKLTTTQLIKKVEEEAERLTHAENAWLKSLGELGDLSRYIIKMQQSQIEQGKMILELLERIKTLEGGPNENIGS
jgi:hypothetical protein